MNTKEREEEEPFFGIAETDHRGKRKADIVNSRDDAGLEPTDTTSSTTDAGISQASYSVLEKRRMVKGKRPTTRKITNSNRFKKMKTTEITTNTGPNEKEDASCLRGKCKPIILPTPPGGAWKDTALSRKRKPETELTVANWDLETPDVSSATSDVFVRAPDSVLANRRVVVGKRVTRKQKNQQGKQPKKKVDPTFHPMSFAESNAYLCALEGVHTGLVSDWLHFLADHHRE